MLQHEQGSSDSVGDSLCESFKDCVCSMENIHYTLGLNSGGGSC